MRKPILFVAVSDRSVLAALERDLDRRFGNDCRILSAHDPSAGLAMLEAISGGQAGASSRIRNFPGFTWGIGGQEFAHRACEQAWLFGAEARAMEGRHVSVVGGGNSAGQAALHLAEHAATVTLLVRGDSLARSMSDYLVRALETKTNVTIRLGIEVVDGVGEERLERVTIRERATDRTESLPASGLFVLIGGVPHTDWLDGVVERDPHGYVITGPDLVREGGLPAGWPLERPPLLLETSVPGVFAAGDVRCRSIKRVASAVGEGAVAIQLVHRALEEGAVSSGSLKPQENRRRKAS